MDKYVGDILTSNEACRTLTLLKQLHPFCSYRYNDLEDVNKRIPVALRNNIKSILEELSDVHGELLEISRKIEPYCSE